MMQDIDVEHKLAALYRFWSACGSKDTGLISQCFTPNAVVELPFALPPILPAMTGTDSIAEIFGRGSSRFAHIRFKQKSANICIPDRMLVVEAASTGKLLNGDI